jgi:hypothetical protein
MERQISVFERAIDGMLVDSPNWLVQGRHETRGIYVEGHGVIFTFDASLVNARWHDDDRWWWGWWKNRGDDRVVIIDRDWDDEEDEDADRRSMRDRWRDREMKRQERYYTRGKTEVVEMLVDFGDLLSSIPDDEWIEVEAFLERAEYFYDKDISRLSVRVRAKDAREYGDGKIDEKTLVERIQTKES